MAKTVAHETIHEVLAYDLLMDAGGDIDKAMARFKADLLTPPTADELNSARECMERTRVNARPARYGAAELIRGNRVLERGTHQAGGGRHKEGEAAMTDADDKMPSARELAEIKLMQDLKRTLESAPFRFAPREIDQILQKTMRMVMSTRSGPAP
jgi:hypothetical protein